MLSTVPKKISERPGIRLSGFKNVSSVHYVASVIECGLEGCNNNNNQYPQQKDLRFDGLRFSKSENGLERFGVRQSFGDGLNRD